MPVELAFGIANTLLVAGFSFSACAVVLCFAGLLRVSEALTLIWRRFLRTADGWVLVLGRLTRRWTRRSRELGRRADKSVGDHTHSL